ncbi:uncharacterized protein PITG_19292 [Phytophthora infestans T30-4]|uniref:Ricin B lectin domain-containing protein n=1 Tax=Phytophthora infestans (strain T30-4) TaxID=403677 RepID=D0NZV7_PHYIT|nr:uncharacterized protein PITG_19292 [Phytophthora infestans T30-4]EEY69673.1 conserved hypothetical protein [Phytophthora infestans T30-4]|eukprot:XP_002997085.1 conserved hypothetical protein [Phytophthora infestans T30-4]
MMGQGKKGHAAEPEALNFQDPVTGGGKYDAKELQRQGNTPVMQPYGQIHDLGPGSISSNIRLGFGTIHGRRVKIFHCCSTPSPRLAKTLKLHHLNSSEVTERARSRPTDGYTSRCLGAVDILAKLKAIPLLFVQVEALELVGKSPLGDCAVNILVLKLFAERVDTIGVDTSIAGNVMNGYLSIYTMKGVFVGVTVYEPMNSSYGVKVRPLAHELVTMLPDFAPRKYRVRMYESDLGVQVDSYNCGMYMLLAFEIFAGSTTMRRTFQYPSAAMKRSLGKSLADNPDSSKSLHAHQVRPMRPKWTKMALAVTSAALSVGGALILYESWQPASSLETVNVSPLVTTLKSSTLSTEEPALLSGQEVLLRVAGKPNLCADDGGRLKPDESAITGQPCNPSNPNQLFIYNSKTHQFYSAKKKGLCLDDGGGWAGFTWARLSKCDAKSSDQRYAFDSNTLMLKNPSKDGYCLDDGGGNTASASKYTIRRCSAKSEDQHFEVLSQATLAAEQQKVLNAVASGAKFLLRVAGKTGMCVSGPSASIAATPLLLAKCNKQSKNQIFTYDASTKRIRSAEKVNYCVDDGGVKKAGKADTRLAPCDTSKDQTFDYDRATMQFTQPNKANLCLDDGSGVLFSTPRLVLRNCDNYSANQHFEYLLQSKLTTASAATTSAGTSSTTASVQSTGTQSGVSMGASAGTSTSTAPVTPTETATEMATGMSGTTTGPTRGAVSAEQTTVSKSSALLPALSPQNEEIPAEVTTATASSAVSQPASYSEVNTSLTSSTAQEPAFASTPAQNEPAQSETQTVYVQETTPPAPESVKQYTPDEAAEQHQASVKDIYSGKATETESSIAAQQSKPTATEVELSPTATDEENAYTTNGEPEETAHGTSMDSRDEIPESEHKYTPLADEPELNPENWHNGEPDSIPGLFPAASHYNEAATTENELKSEHQAVKSADEREPFAVENSRNAEPLITTVDASLASFVDQDWNLLAPSDQTVGRVNTDHSSSISADKIFQFLQSIKDRADIEHERMMYRYKRTFDCVSAGLQTLATASVTTDEYDVLVRWMYNHCAAGNTEIAPPPLPPLPKREFNGEDVAALVNDPSVDVKRQYMTKMDFYHQIKNHFTQTIEQLEGHVAGTHLRSEEKREQQNKLHECIEAAVTHYGYRDSAVSELTAKQLETAISFVDTCIKA